MCATIAGVHPEPLGDAVASGSVQAQRWLEDAHWHRETYRHSRFRWWDSDVLDVVTRYTDGRLDFATVEHLQQLTARQEELLDYEQSCQHALVAPLREAWSVLGDGWEPIAAATGLTVVECSRVVWSSEYAPPRYTTNTQVRRVNAMVDQMVFAGPLIRAVELTQLWRLYQAASQMLEDTICDLVVELEERGRDPVVLAGAAGASSVARLAARVEQARAARGYPGDGRRIPTQSRPDLFT